MYDNKKFNVLIRGKHTLFVVTANKPDGSKRDPELLRKQLANMLFVDLRSVIPNHDYEGLPKGQWLCYRFKGSIPRTIRRPSIEAGSHEFIAKEVVLHFPEAEAEAPKGKEFKTLLEDDDKPQREGDVLTLPPVSNSDITMLLMQRQEQQDALMTKILENQQMLAELMGRLALKL